MKRIDAIVGGEWYTFRTNDSGNYLFVGVGVNRQIACGTGFNSLRRIKKAIREYLVAMHSWTKLPRITYKPDPNSDWVP